MRRVINDFLSVKNEENASIGELHVEGDIVDSKWWDDEVSPSAVASALNEVGKVSQLDVYINSYGGSCVAGNSIVNIIDEYKMRNNCPVNVHIRGVAASMGSGIAMAGDKVYMADNALFMVHKPMTMAFGNADELEQAIEILDKTEHTLRKNYMRKFNGTEEELQDLMAKETWLTAEEAKDLGFVDEITEGVSVAASAKGIEIDNRVFRKEIAGVFERKLPEDKIKEKGEKTLNYDEKLMEFGISKEIFDAFNVKSETVLAIAEACRPANTEEFLSEDRVRESLGEDITAEDVLNYAQAGMHPSQPDPEIQNKATAYDQILEKERADALKEAVRAQGEYFNEDRTKKMLQVLDYDDIMEQKEAWREQAKNALHAGVRVSNGGTTYKQDETGEFEIYNKKDII